MDILIFLVSAIISLIPSIILYKWLKSKSEDEKYKKICKNAFVKGILSVFPIMLMSAFFQIIGRLSGLHKFNDILYQAYYKFIVLAFAEELVKFLTFKSVLKKNEYEYSWFNLTVFMIIVGIGFGCIENLAVAIGSGIIVMAIRAISIGHGVYGLIMGWFYGKMMKTGKKIYGVLSFLVPWLLHGLYDFGLSDELLAVNDNFAIISVSLEVFCIVCVFLIIRFVRKRKDSNIYTEPVEKIK